MYLIQIISFECDGTEPANYSPTFPFEGNSSLCFKLSLNFTA